MSKSFANSIQLTELVNTINSKISDNDNWKKVIRDTNILIDGNPKTIINYLKDKLQYDDITSVIQLNESNVLDVLNFVYTAFKCEYAVLVRYLLNIFFKYISSCEKYFKPESTKISENTSFETSNHNCSLKTITAQFILFKNNIVKMIFNLFNFMDLSQLLKLSDQTFLKSLLSINLFLCHLSNTDIDESSTKSHYNILSDNTADMNDTYQDDHRIIVLKKVFVQIKDLVDLFRCKNCFVGYNYFNDSEDITIDVTLKSLKLQMDNFKDIGLDDDLYNDEMYDTKYLLVKQLFEIKTDQFNNYIKSTMSELYNKTHNSYDITVISNYHNALLKSIEKLFYTKFQYIINMNQKQYLNELLLSTFNDHIKKMIPSKFLSDSCRVLVEKLNSLMNLSDWDETNSSKKEVLELLNNALSKNPLQTKDLDKLINEISIPNLIKNITESVDFKSFFQTYELFEQERNTNEEYNLLTMEIHKKLENRVDSDQDTLDYTGLCKATTALRQILALISLVIIETEKYNMCTKDDDYGDKEQCFQGILRLHLKGVFLYIDDLVEKTNDKNLHQMLVPISFHLENMGWTYRDENDNEAYTQYVTIYQYLLMTLSSIERYELSNCKSPEYNQMIHDKITNDAVNTNAIQGDGKSVVDWLKTQIAFKTIKYNHNKNENEMYTYIDNHMFTEFLKLYNPVIYSTNYQFYWNGHKTYIFNIIQTVTQNVIDYYDIIRYQTILMNWFVSKIYIRINSFLKCSLSEKEIILIKNALLMIDREFNYPEMIKNDYMDTVNMYLNILNTPEMLEIEKANFDNFIKEKLELYDFAAIEAELPKENCTIQSLDTYFEVTEVTMFLMNINLL